MSRIVVNGGRKLLGEIDIQGAKNSVLPVLAATILCERECVIHNCPNLSELMITVFSSLLQQAPRAFKIFIEVSTSDRFGQLCITHSLSQSIVAASTGKTLFLAP